MEPREAERFEEGIESEFQDAEEVETGETSEGLGPSGTRTHESGAFHGGFGSATLQECLDMINQVSTGAPATRHSGVKIEESSNPPQVMSPNVEEKQIHETMSAARPSQDDESQPRVKKEKRKV